MKNFTISQVPSHLIPSDPRFGCGPSLIPTQNIQRLSEFSPHLLGTSHRKKPVINLMISVENELRSFFQLPSDYAIVIGNGGATMLFDMLGLGLIKEKALHHTCGEFSNKWMKASQRIPGLTVLEKKAAPGEGLEIDGDLAASCDFVASTLNETSTGVKLSGVSDFSSHEKTLLLMDATSGAAAIEVDVSKVDAFFFSVQKVFASEGGTHVLFLSPKAQKRIEEIKDSRYIPASFYLPDYLASSEKHQNFNTPSLTSLLLLEMQLKEMNKLGSAEVFQLAKKKAALLYGWAEEKEYLTPFVKEAKYRSEAVATINMDEKIDAQKLVAFLEENKLVYGIDAYRKLGQNQLRISLFHNIAYDDLERLTKLVSHLVES